MYKYTYFVVALAASPFVMSQAITFCKDEDCVDCPSAITTAGEDVKTDCVIYDTQTVFGGQGFEELDGEFLYGAYASYTEPCGGEPGALMIRSPAQLSDLYCGDLARYSTDAGCGSAQVQLQETFMVQFCCGADACTEAGVPFGRRSLGERVPSGPTGGLYLSYPNGTLIEPLAVGKSKTQSDTKVKRDCTNGWENDSYKPNGDWYIATFETQMVTGQVPPDVEDRVITITYDQTVETSTHFDVTIGDPFGVISIGAGFEFSTSTSMGYQVEVSVPANQSGYVGFTPAYKCTRGTITKCGGEVQPEEESCTPFVTNGVVQGDHLLVLGD